MKHVDGLGLSVMCACRDLCDYLLMIIQRENERLRGQVLSLSKAQARKLCKSDSVGSASSAGRPTEEASHAVLSAQLAIAEQQAADFQARITKLCTFFSGSMQDMKMFTQNVLGWKCVHDLTVLDVSLMQM
jgi:hypothetical protein